MSSGRLITRARKRAFAAIALIVATTASAGAGSASATPSPMPTPPDASGNFLFTTLDDHADPTFNQLLGINNAGVIAGYFGSGASGHPNRGYTLGKPYGQANYTSENFPHAVQTQVTGLNDVGITVGFWVNNKGANQGFIAKRRRHFQTINFPRNNAKPKFDQLLGINDAAIAVGFYTDGTGVNHGFTYNLTSKRFHTINVAGDTNVTAAGINNLGDVAGFATNAAGDTEAFLRRADGVVLHLSYPGATSTQAFGVNDGDEVVGAYTVGTGSSAMTHGFIWAPGFGFANIDDPNAVAGTTFVNGINDRGTLVGFFTDSVGNTDGFVAHSNLG